MADSARRFEGKVAFVTGAARGQGRAEAIKLAAEGADIIAVDLCKGAATTRYEGSTKDDLDETVRLVESHDRRIIATRTDVRDFEALSSALHDGVAQLGRLDVVVANAGICTAALSWEVTLEQWEESISTNLTGAFFTAKAAVPILIEQGTGGAIVMTSSAAGMQGLPFLGHYAASKLGVVGLARTMANELGPHRIRVNTVHPYAVATGMTVPELVPMIEEHASTLGPIFMGALPEQFMEAEDIANAVVWLASDEARYVTGVQLPVDLGTLNR